MLSPKVSPNIVRRVTKYMRMQIKNFPVKYLGCSLIVGRQKISHYSDLLSGVTNRARGWQTKFLSLGGKEILIRHVLQSTPIHLLSTVHPPKGVLNQIEKVLASFFWRRSDGNARHHWASWKSLCFPYKEGGAQFRSLEDICKAFTAKIWWNLRTRNSFWREFMLAKYCRSSHPYNAQWYSGQSMHWKALCDHHASII